MCKFYFYIENTSKVSEFIWNNICYNKLRNGQPQYTPSLKAPCTGFIGLPSRKTYFTLQEERNDGIWPQGWLFLGFSRWKRLFVPWSLNSCPLSAFSSWIKTFLPMLSTGSFFCHWWEKTCSTTCLNTSELAQKMQHKCEKPLSTVWCNLRE